MAHVANGGSGADSTAAGTSYQVGPDTWVELRSHVFDADGELVHGAEEALRCVFGYGQLLPKVEQALLGRAAGDRVSVDLRAADAYGDRDEALVVSVDRAELPDSIGPGDRIEVEDPHGAVLVLRILEVEPDAAWVDFNHPLAGQNIRVDLEIRGVRPATSAEMAEAERALAEATPPTPDLLAPERLLRGVGRSYETALVGTVESSAAGRPPTPAPNEPTGGSPIQEKKA